MIVYIPFHPEVPNIGTLAETLLKRGQCDNHTLVVVAHRQYEPGASDFRNEVADLWSDASVVVTDAIDGGLVAMANSLFRTTISHFKNRAPKASEPEATPMLYFDPSWLPSKNGWLDAIQSEFFYKGLPQVLANTTPNARGEKITQGPVLFSREYVKNTALVPHLPANIHWRIYLRHEIAVVEMESETISTGSRSVIRPVKVK